MNFEKYNDLIKCRVQSHEQMGIFGFCLNQQCKRKICFKCLINFHDSHVQDCIHFDYFEDIIQNQLLLLERICSLQSSDQNSENELKTLVNFIRQKIILLNKSLALIQNQDFSDQRLLTEMAFCHNSLTFLKQFITGSILIQNRQKLINQVEQIYQTHEYIGIIQELVDKGDNLREQYYYQQAIKCYEKAIDLNPSNVTLTLNKGLCLHMIEQTEAALECFNFVLQIEPQNTKAQYLINELIDSQKQITMFELEPFKIGNADDFAITMNILDILQCQPQQVVQLYQIMKRHYWKNYKAMTFLSQTLFARNCFEQSLEAVDQALKIYPTFNKALVMKVRCLIQIKKYDEANNILNQSPSKFAPSTVSFFRSTMLSMQNKKEQAFEEAQKYTCLLENKTQKYIFLIQYGLLLENSKRPYEALEYLRQAEKINPNSSKLQDTIGVCLLQLGQDEEAIKCFEKAINIHFEYKRAWFGKAQILIDKQRFKEAIQMYDTYLGKYPQDQEMIFFKEQALSTWRKYDKHLEVAKDNDPNNVEGLISKAGILITQKRFYEALQEYNKVLDIFSNDIFILIAKAFCLIQIKHYQEALEIIDNFILPQDQNELMVLQYKGVALFNMNKHQEALKEFRKVQSLDPLYKEIQLYIGHCLFKIGYISEARDTYFLCLQSSEQYNQGLIQYYYVKSLLYLGQAGEGFQFLLRSLLNNQMDNFHYLLPLIFTIAARNAQEYLYALQTVKAWYDLYKDSELYFSFILFINGDLLFTLGKYEQAIQALDQLSNERTMWIALVVKGNCLLKLNNKIQAELNFNKALQIFGKQWTSEQYERALLEELEKLEEPLKCWTKIQHQSARYSILVELNPQ